jgi:hypothetical protein
VRCAICDVRCCQDVGIPSPRAPTLGSMGKSTIVVDLNRRAPTPTASRDDFSALTPAHPGIAGVAGRGLPPLRAVWDPRRGKNQRGTPSRARGTAGVCHDFLTNHDIPPRARGHTFLKNSSDIPSSPRAHLSTIVDTTRLDLAQVQRLSLPPTLGYPLPVELTLGPCAKCPENAP